MTQLESLTAFLTEHLPPRTMQMFLSAMDNCELVSAAKAMGLNQRRVGYLRYDAIVSWDDFPYRICPPALLYALVLAWVDDYGNELRDTLKLPPPTVDPEFIDEQTAMIQITVPVADEIILRETPDGPIPLKEKRWSVVYADVWTAETGEVIPRRETEQ